MEPREQAHRLPFWRTPALNQQQQAQRKRARVAMVQAIEKRAGLLTFWGDFGSGKTLAMQVVVNELREEHGIEGYYAPLAAILSHLRSLYNANADTSDYWQRLLGIPVLALDEVTRFRTDSQWQQEQLFVLVDTRYRRRDTHLTLFATNDDPRLSLPPEEAIGYLLSRMREGTLCELRGDVRAVAGGTP
jgi:DNA replication protein DnaC